MYHYSIYSYVTTDFILMSYVSLLNTHFAL